MYKYLSECLFSNLWVRYIQRDEISTSLCLCQHQCISRKNSTIPRRNTEAAELLPEGNYFIKPKLSKKVAFPPEWPMAGQVWTNYRNYSSQPVTGAQWEVLKGGWLRANTGEGESEAGLQ